MFLGAQSLLKLGHQIVQALDPSPQDQALDELKEIRKLVEDQKQQALEH